MRRYRVLFVCIGNACRSQMAEAFANAYGDDVLMARSAGLSPCEIVAPATERLMRERGVPLEGAYPKGISLQELDSFDLVVNMSGHDFPYEVSVPVREWEVEDPIWVSEERHREVRDQIEGMVEELILEFRGRRKGLR